MTQILISWLRWLLGFQRTCADCGFGEYAHYNHAAEFDIDKYPCRHFHAQEGVGHER